MIDKCYSKFLWFSNHRFQMQQWLTGWIFSTLFNSTSIHHHVNESAHTFHFIWPYAEHDVVSQLQQAFRQEPLVQISVESSSSNSSHDKRLLYYPKASSSRTCLSIAPPEIEPIFYTGSFALASLVEFINQKSQTFRTVDGSLTEIGQKIDALEQNRYKIKPGDSCPRISAKTLTSEQFQANYVWQQRPVIITDALEHWPDVTTNWRNHTHLRERIGSRPVHVKLSPNGVFEGCEALKHWTTTGTSIPPHVEAALVCPDVVLARPAALEVSFDEFLNRLSLPQTSNTSLYLEYLSMATYLPELQSDTPVFPFAIGLRQKFKNLWYTTTRETVGKLHFDPYENLISMISGEKTFLLYDPSDNTRLYEGHLREGLFQYDKTQDEFSRTHLMESTSMVNSPVDPVEPDLVRFPRFQHATPLRCRIHENETLFVPSFWWHEVYSTFDAAADRPDRRRDNIAVNVWFEPFFTKEYPCAHCPLRVNLNNLAMSE